ncbi:IMP cyclohydrolase [Nonomuraea polychroma]|uniref:IMP cyclohydrolase n=1 Tax=Nonomuraea polychroma TaxID=46176 RepID=A0A438MB29_9ACTN|nr:IMP cyclohydrolase [Nonomuraea polychroma]
MSVPSLRNLFQANRYPGRSVVWARTLDGAMCGGYLLTGRSQASRARALRLRDHELVVGPTEPAENDPLRHYVAAAQRDGWLVFGNGEQVATVADRLLEGQPAAVALDGLNYEPDPPIFTPRITVIVDVSAPANAWFGAARRSLGDRTSTNVLTLSVRDLAPGDAVLMTTYVSDGHRILTGEPFLEGLTTAADQEELLDELWEALDPYYRVAAATFTPHGLAKATLRHQG